MIAIQEHLEATQHARKKWRGKRISPPTELRAAIATSAQVKQEVEAATTTRPVIPRVDKATSKVGAQHRKYHKYVKQTITKRKKAENQGQGQGQGKGQGNPRATERTINNEERNKKLQVELYIFGVHGSINGCCPVKISMSVCTHGAGMPYLAECLGFSLTGKICFPQNY